MLRFILFLYFVQSLYVRASEIIGKSTTPFVKNTTPFGKQMVGYLNGLPETFDWVTGNYLTPNRNQHIPVYCGSCWAFATVTALQDRIKIQRKQSDGVDIVLSTQHVLNCIDDGSSCHGGRVDSVYRWMMEEGIELSYEDSQPYLACSSESDSEFCGVVDTSCKALNIARTCGSFDKESGACKGLSHYPNATISDYGMVRGRESMKNEIYRNGPIACGIDARQILNYVGGIVETKGKEIDHVVEVVGWGSDYWIVRNSWGSYWGEFGFIRVKFGALLLETECTWAKPGHFTSPEHHNQVPCTEGGDCGEIFLDA